MKLGKNLRHDLRNTLERNLRDKLWFSLWMDLRTESLEKFIDNLLVRLNNNLVRKSHE